MKRSSAGSDRTPSCFVYHPYYYSFCQLNIYDLNTHFRQKCVYAKAPHVEPCLDISKRIHKHKVLYCGVCEQPCQTSVYHLSFPEAQTSRQRLHLFFLLKDVSETTAFCSRCFKGRNDVSVTTSEDKLESKLHCLGRDGIRVFFFPYRRVAGFKWSYISSV